MGSLKSVALFGGGNQGDNRQICYVVAVYPRPGTRVRGHFGLIERAPSALGSRPTRRRPRGGRGGPIRRLQRPWQKHHNTRSHGQQFCPMVGGTDAMWEPTQSGARQNDALRGSCPRSHGHQGIREGRSAIGARVSVLQAQTRWAEGCSHRGRRATPTC